MSQKWVTRFLCLSDHESRSDSPLRCAASRRRPERDRYRAAGGVLVDSTGMVRWVNLTENIAVRARPEQALAAIDAMKWIAARD